MKPQNAGPSALAAGLLWLMIPGTLLCQEPEYLVVQIPIQVTSAYCCLNDSGVVAGATDASKVWMWKRGVITYMPDLGGSRNKANAINNSSVITGYVTQDEDYYACAWHGGVLRTLARPDNFIAFSGEAINSAGTIIGNGADTNWNWYPYVYSGSISVLRTLDNYSFHGINDGNVIAATSWSGAPGTVRTGRALLYYNGAITFLSGPSSNTNAYAINTLGHVLGFDASVGLCLWRDGSQIPVGLLRPEWLSGLNDRDVVVGYTAAGGTHSAAIWYKGTTRALDTLIDKSLGIHLVVAFDINNRGQILCRGSDSYLYLLTANGKILAPWESDTWIAGEVDTIRWGGIAGGTTLTLDFSTDDGSSWMMITSGISSDSGKYAWKIPAGTISTKCKVKILDYSTHDSLATSDLFKIKPYLLTRIDPATGDYVAYDMKNDAWGFWNEEPDIWPTTWWSANFDYASGTDPFTGKPYPTWRRDRVFKDALPSDYPDWESFVRAFTIDACYLDTALAIYYDKAVERWGLEKEEFDGACFGLSGTNAMAFSHRDQFLNKFRSFPLTLDGDPATVNPNAAVIRAVAEIHTHQFGNPTVLRDQSYTPRPTQTLRDIREMLRQDDTPIRTLSMRFHGPDPGGHNVLPYKLERESDTSPKWKVFVYDSNEPFDYAATVIIDTADMNGFGWWRFPDLSWNGFKDLQLEEPSIVYLGNAQLPKRQGPASPFAVSAGTLTLYTTKHASIQIKDDVGNTTGFNDNMVQDEIPGSVPLIPVTGRPSAPYGYALASGNYTITVDSFQTSESKVFFFTENTTLGYRRSGATVSQTDNLRFDTTGAPTLSIANHDPGTKSISLKNILSETALEKVYGVYAFELAQNDSVVMTNVEGDRLKLTSYGTAKDYDLTVEQGMKGGLRAFSRMNIPLSANTTHVITPEWETLGDSLLTILVDLGNDGMVDDTLHVRHEVTRTEDHGSLIPGEYRLEQNYPNPFNPTTKIQFTIVTRQLTIVKVYDMLGREVSTLVNEVKEPGTYTVQFDGSNLPSGVYFYRLQAGDFVQTRKLVLLR